MDLFSFLRRKRYRLLAESTRLGIMMQIAEVRETGKDATLLLRFKTLRRMDKPFAEIRLADVTAISLLFNDAEKWLAKALKLAS